MMPITQTFQFVFMTSRRCAQCFVTSGWSEAVFRTDKVLFGRQTSDGRREIAIWILQDSSVDVFKTL